MVDLSGHVNAFADRGMLGLALDPGFADNGHVYLLYTLDADRSAPDGPKTARLSRITVRLDDTVEDAQDPETVLLDDLPSPDITHTIGTVRAAADGTLWIGVGDGNSSGRLDSPILMAPRDPDSAAGKLLHVDGEGRGLPGHPFCPAEDDLDRMSTKVHAKGFRNPFRFALLPDGGLLAADVGWNSSEELDLVAAGRDYGWPCWEGRGKTPGDAELPACAAVYGGSPTAEPLLTYDHWTGFAILAGPLYTASAYPAAYPAAYRGRLIYGDAVTGFVRAISLADPLGEALPLGEQLPYPVDLELTPEGELAYVSITEGSVRAIRYAPEEKTPVARAAASPTAGALPLEVRFSAAGSADPDGDPLSYRWDFGDGSPPAEGPTATHRYDRAGPFVARLTVSDGEGASATDVLISPGNDAPTVTIDAPSEGASFRAGRSVRLLASATDPQDGPLTGSQISWDVTLHHATHTHPFSTLWGAGEVLFTTDSHDADSYYEIRATATDQGGVSASSTVSVRPEAIELRIISEPPGATLSYDGTQLTAPVARRAAIGFRPALTAAPEMTAGGRRYRFASSSNGGPRAQVFTVPDRTTDVVVRHVPVAPDAESADGAAAGAAAGRLRPGLGLGPAGRGALGGPAWDVARLQIAVRRPVTGAGCRWWSQRAGRPASPAGGDRPRWMWATLRGRGLARRWRVVLGGRRAAGRLVLLARGRSAAGERFTRWGNGRRLLRLPQ